MTREIAHLAHPFLPRDATKSQKNQARTHADTEQPFNFDLVSHVGREKTLLARNRPHPLWEIKVRNQFQLIFLKVTLGLPAEITMLIFMDGLFMPLGTQQK